jgi:wobble nucleotide-excising tRNase
MLKTIRVNNYKSFRSGQAVDIQLNVQQRPVLIYGLNGAGKTSIGEVVDRCTRKDPARTAPDCAITYQGDGPFRTLVYNHEFVERVIGAVAGMPGIFTLGEVDTERQASIEIKEKEILEFSGKRANVDGELGALKESIKSVMANHLDQIWKAHTKFSKAGMGVHLAGYGNSKQKFLTDLRQIQTGPSEELPTVDELKQRWEDVQRGESRKALIVFDGSQLGPIESDEIWKQAVEASGESRLSTLVERLGNADWVSRGRTYDANGQCPYCQESLPADFKSELAKMLDGARQDKVDRIEGLARRYKDAVRRMRASFTEQISAEPFARNNEKVTLAWDAFDATVAMNESAMEAKIREPGNAVTVDAVDLEHLLAAIAEVNERIRQFNARVSDRDNEKSNIRTLCWKLMKRDRESEFDSHSAALSPLQKKELELTQQTDALRDKTAAAEVELRELRRMQTGVDASVEAINLHLQSLGILAFRIRRKEAEGSLYVLDRPGVDEAEFRSLSEGEKTLISFLYFIELTKGADQEGPVSPLNRTILVIDDPISSLSVNYVFDVASLISKELIGKPGAYIARQVIVLTHNLFFLHEMIKQFNVSLQKADGKFQLLRVTKHENSNVLSMKATDLMNDYDALWWILREAKNGSLPSYMVPNTMRCILEHFFAFNNRGEDWKAVLDNLEKEDARFRPLARFLDRGSHRDGINLAVMDYGAYDTEYYLTKFRDVFFATNFLAHYDARMGVDD